MDLGASTAMWITATILIMAMRDRCRIAAIVPSRTFKGMKRATGKAMWAMRATSRVENTAPDFQGVDVPAADILGADVLARDWSIGMWEGPPF
jgi:hypothetical protein